MLNATLTTHFEDQAGHCARLGSPFTAQLCRCLPAALNGPFGTVINEWAGDPTPDALALRACGAMKALAAQDSTFAQAFPPHVLDDTALTNALHQAIAAHGDRLLPWLDSAPQTNEVARSAALIGGYLILADQFKMPLALREIGSSAGVNLFADQYHYTLGHGVTWGDASAATKIESMWSGQIPPLTAPLTIVNRAGSDINPLKARDAQARARMLTYIWADQPARQARAEAALMTVANSDLDIAKQGAADWLDTNVTLTPGNVTIVQHTIMWQYMPHAEQTRAQNIIETMGAQATDDAPLAWLRMEADNQPKTAALTLTTWPGGQTRELARAGFHGQLVEWT